MFVLPKTTSLPFSQKGYVLNFRLHCVCGSDSVGFLCGEEKLMKMVQSVALEVEFPQVKNNAVQCERYCIDHVDCGVAG